MERHFIVYADTERSWVKTDEQINVAKHQLIPHVFLLCNVKGIVIGAQHMRDRRFFVTYQSHCDPGKARCKLRRKSANLGVQEALADLGACLVAGTQMADHA